MAGKPKMDRLFRFKDLIVGECFKDILNESVDNPDIYQKIAPTEKQKKHPFFTKNAKNLKRLDDDNSKNHFYDDAIVEVDWRTEKRILARKAKKIEKKRKLVPFRKLKNGDWFKINNPTKRKHCYMKVQQPHAHWNTVDITSGELSVCDQDALFIPVKKPKF